MSWSDTILYVAIICITLLIVKAILNRSKIFLSEFKVFRNSNKNYSTRSVLEVFVLIWRSKAKGDSDKVRSSFFEVIVSLVWLYVIYAAVTYPFKSTLNLLEKSPNQSQNIEAAKERGSN